MKQETLQYFAGIIDSEGHFRLRKHTKRVTLGAEFKMDITNEVIVNKLIKDFGMGKKSIQNRGENRKLVYIVTIGKSELNKFLELILPFLNEKYSSARLIQEYMNLEKEDQKKLADIFYERYLTERYLCTREIIFSYPYMAGIMDGDGYVCISRQKTNKLLLKFGLEQCFKELPYFLLNKFEGNIQVRNPKKKEHRTSYVWNAKIEQAKNISQKCLPFLIEKKDIFKIFLSAIEIKEVLKKMGSVEKEKVFLEYKKEMNKSVDRIIDYVKNH